MIINILILFLMQSMDNFSKNEPHRNSIRPKLALVAVSEILKNLRFFEKIDIFSKKSDFEKKKFCRNFARNHIGELLSYEAATVLMFSKIVHSFASGIK